MPRGGKRDGAGKPRQRFILDKERGKVVKMFAVKYGITEQQVLSLAVDKLVSELFAEQAAE